MIITIDGPMASGKSTTAQQIAKKLGFYYINSGLLFRGMAYTLLNSLKGDKASLASLDKAFLQESITKIEYHYDPENAHASIISQKVDITHLLKTSEISTAASLLATNKETRQLLLHFQQALAQKHNVVVEGRDAGSVVFPNAEYKFFLTASLEARAARWLTYQRSKGIIITLEQAQEDIKQRDERDSQREEAPLKIPENAIIVDNSTLSLQQTVEKIISYIISVI